MRFLTAAAAAITLALAAGTAAAAGTPSPTTAAPQSPVGGARAGYGLYNDNWGGYLAYAPKGKHIDAVGASWTVPRVTLRGHAGPHPFAAAMWVGMDGYNTKVGPEQAGLWIDTDTPGGQPEYWMFYELAPANPVAFTTDGKKLAKDEHNLLKVRPGDKLAAIVQYIDQPGFRWNHQFDFSIWVNGTMYERMAKPGTPAPARNEAEVITEIPKLPDGRPEGALNLGTVAYSYAQYDLAGRPGEVPSPLLAVTQGKGVTAQYAYRNWGQGFTITPGKPAPSNPPRIEHGRTLKDHFTTRVATWSR